MYIKHPQPALAFFWKNPASPQQGGKFKRTVRGQVYSRSVGPRSFLTPSEAAVVLDVRREFVYHLIWNKKVKAVKKKGQYMILFSEVVGYALRRGRRGPATFRE